MKSELKIKWLQYLDFHRDRESGFIYMILLGIAIVCGFLFIALLQLLTRGSKPNRYSEGRNNAGAMGRAQQAFHLEHGYFSNDLEALGLGIPSKTVNYKYEIVGASEEKPSIINNLAIPIEEHEGFAFVSLVSTTIINGETSSIAIVCQSEQPTGKNPIWEGLPTGGTLEDFHCECIRVGGQRMMDLSK